MADDSPRTHGRRGLTRIADSVQLCLLGIPDLTTGGKRGRVMPEIVDWREPPEIVGWQQPPRRRRLFFLILAVIAVVVFFGRTALSYYVEALWFGSLGYRDVFRTTLSLQWALLRPLPPAHFLFCTAGFWHSGGRAGTICQAVARFSSVEKHSS